MTGSNPAVAAANRVHEANLGRLIGHDTVVAAAREALAPIRELHKPVLRYRTGLMEDGFYTSCDHCDGDWPCDTARLIYTSEELTND